MTRGRPDWHVEGHDWPHRQHSRVVKAGGLAWHVQVMGRGPGLLLSHGTGASSHSFRALMPLLAQRYTVVNPDLPGHGFTPLPPRFTPSLPNVAGALRAMLDDLGVVPEVAVGHSAGAAILARLQLDGNLSAQLLVGIASALEPFRGIAGALFPPAARLLAKSGIAAQLIALQAMGEDNVERLVAGTGSTLDDYGVDLYRRLAKRPSHVAAVLAMMAAWDLRPLHAELPRLDVPVLLLAGERDKAVPISQQVSAAARMPRARLVVVEEAGHLLHEEKPELVARLILGELTAATGVEAR